ncbi:MAG: UDP-4-amino-4-deoxy-L-arabinose--oxoglutarate aminotransferase [Syntrophus sp. SKADARSKE-3]|nr:UDP-4-amino-4-deoxy-L-arabinose--oxoglutarate aminotransferase [Syntrophus sp. SKADARSKE-3]
MKIRKDFLPLNRPSIGEDDIEAVNRCLRSSWITTGAICKDFEDRFSHLTGAAYAVSLTSATAGLHLTLLALGIGPGDEVITPSMTFVSTVNMITMTGATPVFVDCDYGTLNIRPELVEEKITPRTKVIIPVHFAGAPADMEPILAVADRHGLTVIEDAAHAIGTSYKGVHVGGLGRIAIFSFHPIKNITTGEGGMVTHSDAEFEKKLRLLRFHGIERDAWKRYGKGGNTDYDVASPGFKYNLTDMQAALGVSQMRKMAAFNDRRAELVRCYRQGLEGISGLDLPEVPGYDHDHAWHLFIIKIKAMAREQFMTRLGDFNIGYGLHFPPVHLLQYVRERFGTGRGMLPDTERAADRIISLPLFPDMTQNDVGYVCDAIREILA